MSLAVRVIPCLDVDAGRVVKGVNFENLRDAGDPVELARRYNAAGADEITFLDVTASTSDRATTYDVVTRTAEEVFIPLTVGGGVRSPEDVRALLLAGADKVAVNSAAVARPELVADIAERFGSQCCVASVDARRTGDRWEVFTHGGRRATGGSALAGGGLLGTDGGVGHGGPFDSGQGESLSTVGVPQRLRKPVAQRPQRPRAPRHPSCVRPTPTKGETQCHRGAAGALGRAPVAAVSRAADVAKAG